MGGATQNPPVLGTLGVRLPLPAPAQTRQNKQLGGASFRMREIICDRLHFRRITDAERILNRRVIPSGKLAKQDCASFGGENLMPSPSQVRTGSVGVEKLRDPGACRVLNPRS